MSISTDEAATDEFLAEHFDIYSPAVNERLFDILKIMREKGGLHFSPEHGGHWVAVTHAEAKKTARDWKTFTSAQGVVLGDPEIRKFGPIEYDPPLHQQYRNIINPFFTRDAARAYEPALAAYADGLIDKFIGAGSADLTEQYAKPIANYMFFELLFEFPPEQADFCDDATNDAMFSSDPMARMAGFNRLAEFTKDVVTRANAGEPMAEVINAVRTATIEGRPITVDEAAGVLQVLILGGHDTTVHAMGNMFIQLAQNPDARQSIVNDLALVPKAVEESLRHMTPAVTISRTVRDTCVFEGHAMQSGQKLCPMWISANRDEAVFPDADQFRLERDNINQHVAFGVTPHKCVGEWVAKSLLKVITERLLLRIPQFTLPDDFEVKYRMGQTRGPISVPVRF